MEVVRKPPIFGDYESICTGSIIGKKYIISAAHCFDTGDKYDERYLFFLGTFKTRDRSGQIRHRETIAGIDKNFKRVDFPINLDNGENAYNISIDLLDVVVVTLKENITFIDRVKKARIELPQPQAPNGEPNTCNGCLGSCDQSNIFNAYGWGAFGQSN